MRVHSAAGQTANVETVEQHDGFAVRVRDPYDRPFYIRSIYDGRIQWTRDHTYAKHFSEGTAAMHAFFIACQLEGRQWTDPML